MLDDTDARLDAAKDYFFWKDIRALARCMTWCAILFEIVHLVLNATIPDWGTFRTVYLYGVCAGAFWWALIFKFSKLGSESAQFYADERQELAVKHTCQKIAHDVFCMKWATFWSTPITWVPGLLLFLLMQFLKYRDLRSGWSDYPSR